MRPLDVVLALHDPLFTEKLLTALGPEFRNVVTVQSSAELHYAVPRLRAPVALVDLEMFSYRELKQLCSEFPGTSFISLHRLADERMWSESLANGAADCCQSSDVRSILFATDRCVTPARGAAA